jgi:hypothetical protein
MNERAIREFVNRRWREVADAKRAFWAGRFAQDQRFGGMSVEETASVLGVSVDTVMRDWKLANVWLLREMGAGT